MPADPGFSQDWLRPLLELAESAPADAVRLAALMAAARFPADRHALQEIARLGLPLVAGGRIRGVALRFAATLPLISVREVLRDMEADDSDPDRDAIRDGLSAAGDLSHLNDWLSRAARGDARAYRMLAAMPLEQSGLCAEDIPAPGNSPEILLWRALALGRVGDLDALERTAAQPEFARLLGPQPTSFWFRLAARPCFPESQTQYMTNLLARLKHHRTLKNLAPEAGDALARILSALVDRPGAVRARLLPRPPAGRRKERLEDDAFVSEYLSGSRGPSPFRLAGQAEIALALADVPPERLIRDAVAHVLALRSVKAQVAALKILALAADCQAGGGPARDENGEWHFVAQPWRPLIDDRTRMLRAKPPRKMVYAQEAPPALEALDLLVETGAEFDADIDIPFDADIDADFEAASPMPASAGAEPPTFESSPAAAAEEETPSPAAAPEPAAPSPPPMAGQPPAAEPSPSTVEKPAARRPTVPAAEADERRVRAKILVDEQERSAFLAGASNTIRCWIGLPAADGAANANAPIPPVAIPEGGLDLSVELCWNNQKASAKTVLPANRSARSGDCDLTIDVPANARFVSAEIAFRYRGRCFEVVTVEAAVLQPGDEAGSRDGLTVTVQHSRRETLVIDDAPQFDGTLLYGRNNPAGTATPATGTPPSLRVYAGDGGRDFALETPAAALTAINGQLFAATRLLARRAADGADSAGNGRLDVGDEEVRVLLRDMARFGTVLYNQLRDGGFEDPGDRLQLIDFEPATLWPIEFVYDRGYPADDATVCDGWFDTLDAIDSGAPTCPKCGNAPLSDRQRRLTHTICPCGFWSLRKVIERMTSDRGASAPTPSARRLPRLTSAVFASSDKVPQAERQASLDILQQHIPAASEAKNWDEWCTAVETHPQLLIALPHHGETAIEDYLEIGDPQRIGPDLSWLRRGQINAACVNPDGQEPGPIVLLLGCRTAAEQDLGYAGIIRLFLQQKSALVLGTQAQVLGRDASPLAGEIVSQLMEKNDGKSDLGVTLRRVRCRMFARGYLLALCLVALGDSAWQLAPSSATP